MVRTILGDRNRATKSNRRPREDNDQNIGPKSSLSLISLHGGTTRSGRVFKNLPKALQIHAPPSAPPMHLAASSAACSAVLSENEPLLNDEVINCLASSHGLDLSSIRALRTVCKSVRVAASSITRKIRAGVSCTRGYGEEASYPWSSQQLGRALELAAEAYPSAKEDLMVVLPNYPSPGKIWNLNLPILPDIDRNIGDVYRQIASLYPDLKRLSLNGSLAFKASIAPLTKLKRLLSLDLSDASRIVSSDLVLISIEMTQLTELKLHRPGGSRYHARGLCEIYANDLAQLSNLHSLQSLQIGVFSDITVDHFVSLDSITSLRSLEIYENHNHLGYINSAAAIESLRTLSRLDSLCIPLSHNVMYELANDDSDPEDELAWRKAITSLIRCPIKRLRVHSQSLPLFFIDAISRVLQSQSRVLDLLAFYFEWGTSEKPIGFDPSGLSRVKTLELHVMKFILLSSVDWLLGLPNFKPLPLLSDSAEDSEEAGGQYRSHYDNLLGCAYSGKVPWHYRKRFNDL